MLEQFSLTPQVVYFIGTMYPEDPVKIGYASNIDRRLKSLQTAHVDTLYVLAHVTGGKHLEGIYHNRFRDQNIVREWFVRSPVICDEIFRLSQLWRLDHGHAPLPSTDRQKMWWPECAGDCTPKWTASA